MSLTRRLILMRVLVPTDEILSFVSQKKVSKKRRPGCRLLPAFLSIGGVAGRNLLYSGKRGIPAESLRAIPDKHSDTQRGIREYCNWLSFVAPISDLVIAAISSIKLVRMITLSLDLLTALVS